MTTELTITFPDGTSLAAPSARHLLRAWAAGQWHDASDDQGWRDELAKRAYIWSGRIVNTEAPPLRFLFELEASGLIKIIDKPTNGRSH